MGLIKNELITKIPIGKVKEKKITKERMINFCLMKKEFKCESSDIINNEDMHKIIPIMKNSSSFILGICPKVFGKCIRRS